MNLGKIIGKLKARIQRGYSLVSVGGWGLIITDVVIRWLNLPKFYAIFILPLGLLGLYILGVIDDKIHIIHGETGYLTGRNPVILTILTKLDDIEKHLQVKKSMEDVKP